MNTNRILLINAFLFIDHKLQKGSLAICDDKIEKIFLDPVHIPHSFLEYQQINCEEGIVSFGFIDPHVHFRCPGNENKEDWTSGSKSAIKGGFTYVIDMPNNKPPAIDYSTLKIKNEIARKNSLVNYGFHIGLTDENAPTIKETIQKCRLDSIPIHGIKSFLGSSTGNLLTKHDETIKIALKTGEIVLFHAENDENICPCEYTTIFEHEKSRPAIAERNAIERIQTIAESIKEIANIYICHISSKSGVEAAINARNLGVRMMLEITPHHIYLSLDDIADSPIFKINPPIRSYSDVHFLQQSFSSGRFDCVGTDHAPHLLDEKISHNPPSGFPGLETAFYVFSKLVEKDLASLEDVLHYFTNAYSIFNIKNRGVLKENNYADLVILKKKTTVFNAEDSMTKAKFSPFNKLESQLTIDTVIVNGNIKMINNQIV